tara:strand:+ start:2206 stop:2646 length:441 start_codon:yes stop_codon:yes gene_type:complete
MESITQLQKTIKLSQVKIKLHNIKLECDLENDDFEDLIMDFMGWDREDEEEVELKKPDDIVPPLPWTEYNAIDKLFVNKHKPTPNRKYKYGTKGVSPANWGDGSIWIFRGYSYLNKKPVNKHFKGVDARKDATNYGRGVWSKYPTL